MCTKYKDIFAALAAPFSTAEVKTRLQAGRQMRYVTARTIMNRLDEVVGPESWWDDYTPLEHSVICRLTVRLPDGTIVTKSDAGGEAGMADLGDNDKSGFSDAFKRAAVKRASDIHDSREARSFKLASRIWSFSVGYLTRQVDLILLTTTVIVDMSSVMNASRCFRSLTDAHIRPAPDRR